MRTNEELYDILMETLNLSTEMSEGFREVNRKLDEANHKLGRILMADQAIVDAISTLLADVTALINADASNPALIASLQAQIAASVAADANLAALAPQIAAVTAAAIAATPPPVVTPPAGNPEGVAWSATITYVAKDTALDPSGSGQLWTAVTPVLGEAPGVVAGNWI